MTSAIQTQLNNKVPTSRTINGKALTSNITITKSDVGLGNVDNTSDANKPVSTATQQALDAKQNTITGAATTITGSNLTANRVLIANGSGKVAVSAVTSTELGYLDGVTSAIQTQLNGKVPTTRTINGKALSANISLTKSDIGLGNVNNTSDANKPISTATQAALDTKADKSNMPKGVWGGDVPLTAGMLLSQDTYFGGGSASGTLFLLTLYCTGNDAWSNNCVTVPIEQHYGFQSNAEFTIPSSRGAPERGRFVLDWGFYPDVKITTVDAAQISSSGGTNWGNANNRYHMIQVTRINPA